MQNYVKIQYKTLSVVALVAIVAAALIECDRQAAGRRLQPTQGFNSPCGTSEQVAARVGRCLDPIFELVEGKFNEPRGDGDILRVCQDFNQTERCIRTISKDCLTGVHRTAVSAVASATKRFRQAECKTEGTRGRYMEPLKCVRAHGKAMAGLFRDHTYKVQAVRDLPIPPEQKLTKTCCLLTALDREIENLFNRVCPKSTSLIIGIVHAMTDDARSTLCINPKCQGAMDGVVPNRNKPLNQNFIEPVMQVLFELSDS